MISDEEIRLLAREYKLSLEALLAIAKCEAHSKDSHSCGRESKCLHFTMDVYYLSDSDAAIDQVILDYYTRESIRKLKPTRIKRP